MILEEEGVIVGVLNKSEDVVSERQEVEKTIDKLTLFDDDLMSAVFERNIAATELLLRIILQKKMRVVYVKGQEQLKNPLQKGRTIVLDIKAIDEGGKHVNIEVQRKKSGAHVRRARFHSSMLDVRMLKKGQKFKELKDSYVIFICEKDIFKEGNPIYCIERMIMETGKQFHDGSHIIYVNGQYKGNDDIGKLIRDFKCKSSKEMEYSELAEGVRYYKETTEGRDIMCEAFEKLANERVQRIKKEKDREIQDQKEQIQDQKEQIQDQKKQIKDQREQLQEKERTIEELQKKLEQK